MTTTTTAETKRIIFKCQNKSCKHVWARDYTSKVCLNPVDERTIERCIAMGQPWRFQYIYYRIDETGRKVRHDHEPCCPKCRKLSFDSNMVKGVKTEKKCDARCRNATSGVCECSCGGEFHGCNHL